MVKSDEMKTPSSPKHSILTTAYLLLYNVAQVIAWSIIFARGFIHFNNEKSTNGMYKEVSFWLKVAQTASILEIIHSIFGLVRSSVFTTLPQIASRLFIVWIITDSLLIHDRENKNTIGFPMLLFAWTVTEIIRYSYYANALVGRILAPLQWCRYTFFIILYPMGVAGELICFYRALPYATRSKRFTVSMPNVLNFSFDFVTCSYLIFLLYAPGFYHLYTYMFRQRAKVLGEAKRKAN